MSRPQEIRKERLLGNFRNRGFRQKHKNSERYKQRPGMSDEHLALVRALPCVVCGKEPCGEVHHLNSGTGERGAGLRSTDKWGVPLCRIDHDIVERAGSRREVSTFEAWGIDAHVLAQDLWAATGSLERMRAIVVAHMP